MHFRSLRILGAAVLAAGLLTGTTLAAGKIEATPAPMTAKPDLSSMKFFAGTWECVNHSSRRPGPFNTTEAYSLDDGGSWLNEHIVTHKASWIPADLSSDAKITWNAKLKKWVALSTTPDGAYGVNMSPNWNNGALAWTNVLMSNGAIGSNVTTRMPVILKKVSDTKYTTSTSFKTSSGLNVTATSVCTKNP